MTKEQKFYKALQEIFIGAKIEGNWRWTAFASEKYIHRKIS